MQTAVFTLYFALIAINPVHAQTVTVEEGKQYTNKTQSKGNLDNLMQDIQDMIDDITAKRNDFDGDIRDLENKIISITPPTCSGANNKPTWDGSTWTCTSDNIGTFQIEANWSVGTWGACSATCGGGAQTRSVSCPANSICSGTKPTNTQSCNTQACVVVAKKDCPAVTLYGTFTLIPAIKHGQSANVARYAPRTFDEFKQMYGRGPQGAEWGILASNICSGTVASCNDGTRTLSSHVGRRIWCGG